MLEPLVNNTSYVLAQLVAGRIRCVFCDSMEKVLLGACTWFPLDVASYTISLYFALNTSAVINYSHEYDYKLSPVSPSCKSLNLGVVLGTLNTDVETGGGIHDQEGMKIIITF